MSENTPELSVREDASSRPKPCGLFARRCGGILAFRTRSQPWRSTFRSRVLQALVVACLAIVMVGADNPDKRYERIGHNMMCACGCGQILLECNHVSCPSSGPMTAELRTLVNGGNVGGGPGISKTGINAGGGSDRAILDWFIEKYGATVLASPIRGGFDNVAWITPISVFLIAILGAALIIRIWKARTAQRVPLKIKGMTTSSTNDLRERIRRETEY